MALELDKLTLASLSRLTLGSWLLLFGAAAAIFGVGVAFAGWTGLAPDAAEITSLRIQSQSKDDAIEDLENNLAEKVQSVAGLTDNLQTVRGQVTSLEGELMSCQSNNSSISGELATCRTKLDNPEVGLWLVYQGEGTGYPEGNNGIIANLDDRPNWDSTHYKRERCLQHGGARINEAYAQNICGQENAVGPFGVFSINGRTCGHAFYVIGCTASQ